METVFVQSPNYDNVNYTFGFAPGFAGGVYPEILRIIPLISLPLTNLVEQHSITSCLVANSDK